MTSGFGRDALLVLSARGLRGFAYGFLGVVLALHFAAAGLDAAAIGLLLTLALAGSAATTLWVGLRGDRWGRRRSLAFLASLLALSGLLLAAPPRVELLTAAVLLGALSPTGTDTGPFLPLEQAILPSTVSPGRRNQLFGHYNLVGGLAASAGALAGGLPSVLSGLGWGSGEVLRGSMLLVVLCGALMCLLYLHLSPSAEVSGETPQRALSPKSRPRVARLSLLFAADSLAGGFVIQSFVSYWFVTQTGMALAHVSLLFAAGNLLTALSYILAARLADRIGLVNTLVFTHLPSNLLLMAVPLAPTPAAAAALWLARVGLSQMDVPTRQSYTVAIVPPEDRTAAAGATHLSRVSAQAVSPVVAGHVLQQVSGAIPFFLGGGLKIAYDIALWTSFHRLPAEGERVRR